MRRALALGLIAAVIALLATLAFDDDSQPRDPNPGTAAPQPDPIAKATPAESGASPISSSESAADAPPSRVPIASGLTFKTLQSQHHDLLDYFCRMLRDAERPPIAEEARISPEDVDNLLMAIQESRNQVKECDRAWNRAVSARVDRAIDEITTALRAGTNPQYPVRHRRTRLPNTGRFDKVSIHTPAGSIDQYVIALPETLFPQEVQAIRNALHMQADLFDHTLRQLFSN